MLKTYLASSAPAALSFRKCWYEVKRARIHNRVKCPAINRFGFPIAERATFGQGVITTAAGWLEVIHAAQQREVPQRRGQVSCVNPSRPTRRTQEDTRRSVG